MLSETNTLIKRNFWLFAALIFFICVFSTYLQYGGHKGGASSENFIFFFLMFYAQRDLIKSESLKQFTMKGFMPFSMEHLLFIIASVFPAIGFSMIILGSNAAPDQIGGLVIILFLIIYPVIVALFGTWPTSAIAGYSTGPFQAFRRGLKNFFPTLLRCFAGLILPTIVPGTVAIAFGIETISKAGGFDIRFLLLLIVSHLLQAFGICYTAVVLVRKFQTYEEDRRISPPETQVATADIA